MNIQAGFSISAGYEWIRPREALPPDIDAVPARCLVRASCNA